MSGSNIKVLIGGGRGKLEGQERHAGKGETEEGPASSTWKLGDRHMVAHGLREKRGERVRGPGADIASGLKCLGNCSGKGEQN